MILILNDLLDESASNANFDQNVEAGMHVRQALAPFKGAFQPRELEFLDEVVRSAAEGLDERLRSGADLIARRIFEAYQQGETNREHFVRIGRND